MSKAEGFEALLLDPAGVGSELGGVEGAGEGR